MHIFLKKLQNIPDSRFYITLDKYLKFFIMKKRGVYEIKRRFGKIKANS